MVSEEVVNTCSYRGLIARIGYMILRDTAEEMRLKLYHGIRRYEPLREGFSTTDLDKGYCSPTSWRQILPLAVTGPAKSDLKTLKVCCFHRPHSDDPQLARCAMPLRFLGFQNQKTAKRCNMQTRNGCASDLPGIVLESPSAFYNQLDVAIRGSTQKAPCWTGVLTVGPPR
jgi:hypothetical protein